MGTDEVIKDKPKCYKDKYQWSMNKDQCFFGNLHCGIERKNINFWKNKQVGY